MTSGRCFRGHDEVPARVSKSGSGVPPIAEPVAAKIGRCNEEESFAASLPLRYEPSLSVRLSRSQPPPHSFATVGGRTVSAVILSSAPSSVNGGGGARRSCRRSGPFHTRRAIATHASFAPHSSPPSPFPPPPSHACLIAHTFCSPNTHAAPCTDCVFRCFDEEAHPMCSLCELRPRVLNRREHRWR